MKDGYPLLKQSFPNMLNRTEIIDTVIEYYQDKIQEWNIASLCNNDIVLALKDERKNDKEYSIEFHEFEHQLASSDFFLAPPGNGMPHCHNCMEALRNGAIPILNYANWFKPELEDGINCLTFGNKEELIGCINRALNMNYDEVMKMRKNAKEYYNYYCSSNAILEMMHNYFYRRSRVCFLANDEGTSIKMRIEALEKNENRSIGEK